MIEFDNHKRRIDFGFIAALFLLFSVTSFTLILIGIKQYNYTADSISTNNENRTAASFIIEKIRQYDNNGAISVTTLDVCNALKISTELETGEYNMFIYYYDGYLRELLVSSSSVYSADSGQMIIPASDFNVAIKKNNLIKFTITDTNNDINTFYVSYKS